MDPVLAPPAAEAGVPAPTRPRTPLHTRRITYQGYQRDDGLYEIEAELIDTKGYRTPMRERGLLEPGQPVHHMVVRVAVDTGLRIHEAAAWMLSTPFGECSTAAAPVERLVGASIGKGWRRTIDEAMGGVGGCTHLRELISALGTATIQTISGHAEHDRRTEEEAGAAAPDAPMPYYVGKCKTWDTAGPVVRRLMPQFYRPREG